MTHMFAAIGIGPFDTAWLAEALILTTPILLAAMGELISERAGVLNVGLEGFMLAGAFFSYLMAWKAHSLFVGVVCGIAAGMLFAVVMGLLTIPAVRRPDGRAFLIALGVWGLARAIVAATWRDPIAAGPFRLEQVLDLGVVVGSAVLLGLLAVRRRRRGPDVLTVVAETPMDPR